MKNIKATILLILLSFNALSQDINQDYQLSPKESQLTTQERETKKAALNYAKFWNTGDEHYLQLALHQNFLDKNLPEGRAQGIEGPKDASVFFRKAVPDLNCTIEAIYIIEDKAVVRLNFKGSFSGDFGNKKGRSQKINFSAVDMYTVKEGKIIENWHLEDNLTLMKQLGAVTFN